MPERGKRPRNRRALILSSAAELFYRRGYDRVSMGEIADAVSVGPSALYRHFSGKQDLLYEVLTGRLARVHDMLTGLDLADRDTSLAQLSALALDERQRPVWAALHHRLVCRCCCPVRSAVLARLSLAMRSVSGSGSTSRSARRFWSWR